MKILSYRELIQMTPVLDIKPEVPVRSVIFELAAWQHEVIAIMGPRHNCLKVLNQAFRKRGLASTPDELQAFVNHNFAFTFEQDLMQSGLTLQEFFIKLLNQVTEDPGKANLDILLQQVFWATYLQPYSTVTYNKLTSPVRQRVLIAYLYLRVRNYILLPDFMSQAEEHDKILLHKTLQNLRLLFNEPKTIFFYTQNPDEAIYISDRILILTHQLSGRVGDVIPVAFKEPRHRHIICELPAFKAIRKKLIYLLTDQFAPIDRILPAPINLLS